MSGYTPNPLNAKPAVRSQPALPGRRSSSVAPAAGPALPPRQSRRSPQVVGGAVDGRRASQSAPSVPMQAPRQAQSRHGGPSGVASRSNTSFDSTQRKNLKIQFAKADRNRDGLLTFDEFWAALQGAQVYSVVYSPGLTHQQRFLPNLKKASRAVATANFQANERRGGFLDINGFLKVVRVTSGMDLANTCRCWTT